jgi:hypothetical protein
MLADLRHWILKIVARVPAELTYIQRMVPSCKKGGTPGVGVQDRPEGKTGLVSEVGQFMLPETNTRGYAWTSPQYINFYVGSNVGLKSILPVKIH